MAFSQREFQGTSTSVTYDFEASGGANEKYTGKIEITDAGGRIWFDQLQTWTDLQSITFDSNTNTLSFIRPTPYGNQQWTGVISGNQISGKANGYTYTGTEEVSQLASIPTWGWIALAGGIGLFILLRRGKKKVSE
jgi:hypothetical protein